MENFNKIWRAFFAVMIIAIAIQQLVCGDLRPVILPPSYPTWLADRIAWTWIVSILMIVSGCALLFDYKGRAVALIMGDVFLLLFLCFHLPFHLGIKDPVGGWGDAFKMLTLSGGSYIVAGTFDSEHDESVLVQYSAALIPLGKYFFCIMLIIFGAEHFIYKDFVATLVPDWIPGHVFWTCFAGVALILAGAVIGVDSLIIAVSPNFPSFPRRYAAFLLGIALTSWFIVLHIPRAIAYPHLGNGNEWTSVFEAFGFAGVAFMLSGKQAQNHVSARAYSF